MTSTDSGRTRLPVYEILARDIKTLGFHSVFGLMSDDTVEFAVTMDAIGVRFHGARHENNAVCMAEGFAAATGGIGLALIGRGPATANGLHASVYALRSASRVLLMSGDEAAGKSNSNGFGPDYKAFNAQGVLTQSGFEVFRPTSPETARQTLHDALRATAAGRGAAFLLPVDIQVAEVEVDLNLALPDLETPPPPVPDASEQSIQVAAGLLNNAERPVIIAGRGAHKSGARDALIQLAEHTGALLATSARAKEMFAGHPYNIGIIGSFSTSVARRHVEQADCVMTFGAGLNCFTSSWGMSVPSVPLIQVDSVRSNIGQWLNADVGVVGDAKQVANVLCDAVTPRDDSRKPFHTQTTQDALANFDLRVDYQEAHTARTVDPRSLCLALDAALPQKRNVVYDAGNFMGVVPYFKVPGPDHFKITTDFASIGIGFGTALGFAKARPDHTTVLVIGDGGFMMTLSELETVVREDLPIVIVIMNDCAYGAELHVLRPRQLPVEKSLFPDINFADVAACFAFESATIRTMDDLAAIAPLLKDPQGPILLDCKINADIAAPFMAELEAAHSGD